MIDQDRIIKVNIDEEMKSSYIDYSMSVIVSRALPDVRDGFKPVHRRVLFGMNELGNNSDKPYKKSARIVGEVMGKYHPHGDSSIYGTLVRMAQHWSMRYPLVDGQGNFGSVDGDSPAAMRYTEARLRKLSEDMLVDINKDTVDFQLNFDDTLKEPTVLPSRIPNLLVNGSSGIAVGMATNMAPHNLSEVVDATIAYIDNNDIEISEILKYIKAPDFPTGGIIYGYAGVKEAFETGRGRIVVRSKVEIETDAQGREKIVINEIPYQVNKVELIKAVVALVEDKKVEGIAHINDESDREGMRIVVDVKRDANSSVVLNKLFKYTALQSSFSVNNIALVHGRPRMLNVKDLIHYFVEHRHEVVIRRTRFELGEAEKRAHLLEGFMIILDNLDEAIQIIRDSKTPDEARTRLMERFGLSEIQSRAIVEMRLRQLTGMEQDKLRAEYEEVMKLIAHLKEILEKIELRMQIIKDELLEVKAKYGDARRTQIVYSSEEFNPEDFYADDEMIITISHLGYIKRTALSEFRAQGRGGVGSKGSDSRDEDFIEYIYPASMHNTMLFFTSKGKCYWLKVYDIPEGSKNSKGRAIQNMLNIDNDDKVNAFIRVKGLNDPEYTKSHYLIFATKNGVIKKTSLEAYSRPRQNGVNAITIREDDQVIQVRLTDGNSEVLMANRNGRAIRFHESKVREMGRTATGVRGMTLDEDGEDELVGMICVNKEDNENIMVVSQQGYGKRTLLDEVDDEGNLMLDENGETIPVYRVTNRGGKGVKTMNITDKTGKLVTIKNVTDENDLMIINKSGITIRLKVADFRVMGRATQGVRLINLEKRNDEIASVCKVLSENEEEVVEETEVSAVPVTDAVVGETETDVQTETEEQVEE
ncbi:DNA gyrase subunit A [Paludibacter propionicigenes WB4]|uniref:DNA gyrase subunit A n=1 Tax=Paludibacter propionicigenes (strain DSM 17365 / JCM 13257 / WB4) TaxID=694427 RepID=E4T2N1_PALPW|nr:DNA gyrase subunit A [Paludibacter propionicigenes]ADQ78975.1 DNA gyrase subunit A [Paludibacter propionicigenes WB4]